MIPKATESTMNTAENDAADEDYIEEEFLVYADFQSKISSSALRDADNIKIIGFETGAPIIEIDDKIFKGSFEHAMGTHVFFDKNPIPPASMPNYEVIPDTWYKYLCQSDRVMRMNRLFVSPKEEQKPPTADATSTSDASSSRTADDIVAVEAEIVEPAAKAQEEVVISKSYAQALSQFLRPGEEAPREPDPEDEEFFAKFGEKSAETKDVSVGKDVEPGVSK